MELPYYFQAATKSPALGRAYVEVCMDYGTMLKYAAIALQMIAATAIIFAIFASRRAERAIAKVSSSRASRREAAASSRNACCSASQATAWRPTSSFCCASTRTAVSPFFSKAARCERSLAIPEPLVTSDVEEAAKLVAALVAQTRLLRALEADYGARHEPTIADICAVAEALEAELGPRRQDRLH